MIFGSSTASQEHALVQGYRTILEKANAGRAAGNESGGRQNDSHQRTNGAAIICQRPDFATPTTTKRPTPKTRGSDAPKTSNPFRPYHTRNGQCQYRRH